MKRALSITLPPATVQALHDGCFALYGFAAVRYGPRTNLRGFGGGYPLVWLRNDRYLQNNVVAWSDAPVMFISTTAPSENAIIAIGASQAVAVGGTVRVDAYGGLTPILSGSPGVVSIVNQGDQAWTCGLAADAGAGPAPICAFPLYGGLMDMIAPTSKILVMFAVNSLASGAAVSTAYSSGLLIDFADQPTRAVAFDINKGWDAGGAIWATPVPPQTDLGALLITP